MEPDQLTENIHNIDSAVTEDNLQVKQQTLLWLFSILSSLLLYIVIAIFIQSAYRPDIEHLKSIGNELLIANDFVRPEPMEALLFRIAVILIPLCLLVFYFIYSKSRWIKVLANNLFFHFFSSICVLLTAAMIYFDLSANNPFGPDGGDIPQTLKDKTSATNFDLYFGDIFLGNHLPVYLFVIAPAICCLFFIGIKRYKWDQKRIFNVTTSVVGYSLLATLVGACIAMCVFYFPYQSENKYDLSAVYYSMTQVFAGSPLLVDHFTNTYGLYPHFLNLLFQITGLNVLKFSLVMAILTGVSFMMNFYVLKQFTRNKVILFLGMTSVVFIPFLDIKLIENFDPIFSFYPIRYIVPSTLLFLSTLYLKKKSKAVYWFTSFTMAFLVLWNPEFGIVSYISWLLFNSYIDWYKEDGKFNYRKIISHWITGIGLLIIVFYLYKGLIYVFYGNAPDMGLLWTTILIISRIGFNLLPMTLLHPWNIMALIIIVGFTLSLVKWLNREKSDKASIIFLLTVISVGFFFYFQGRSHNWNLFMSSGMSLMLLTLIGDALWQIINKKNIFTLNLLFILFIYIISFSFVEVLANPGRIYDLVTQQKDKSENAEEEKILEGGRDFVSNNSQAYQKIHIFTIRKYQDLYFDGSRRRSAFNPGMIDLFFNSDIARLESEVVDSPFSIFITPGTFSGMAFMCRPIAAIAATYEYTSGDHYMTLLSKRKYGIIAKEFFREEQVFHRKYSNDRNSDLARVNDAFGVKSFVLNSNFSVEVLFNSSYQIFPFATLIGNQGNLDSSGFSISRILESPKCLFAINGTGFALPVPYNGWVYLTMNVFPDHFEVYLDGALMWKHQLAVPMRTSNENTCVGNLGYLHNYVGAISEVAITKNAMDSTEIKRTWNEIKDAFTYKR